MFVGIDDISFYASDFYLSLATLAQHNGKDPNKYLQGLGQHQMGVLPCDEDIVTMAANAAYPLVANKGTDKIRTLLFATESGVDQSKAAGLYVHRLLNLHQNMRIIELKQACYSATAALQMACALVEKNPQHEVLVIASDVARYGLNTPGEATQGCGAVAMRITAQPRLLSMDAACGCYSEEIMDFWRPNYMDTALVDGKFSAQAYLKALKYSWNDYQQTGGRPFASLARFCYHLPFGKMGEKAHRKLALINKFSLTEEEISDTLLSSLLYNRYIGNSYAASLYICLLSLLENDESDLSGKPVGLFSYGSGCVGEFFSMEVQPGYQAFSRKQQHFDMLEKRTEIDYQRYTELFNLQWSTCGKEMILPKQTKGRYRLGAIRNHQRIYEPVSEIKTTSKVNMNTQTDNCY